MQPVYILLPALNNTHFMYNPNDRFFWENPMARIPPEELERLKAEFSVEDLVAASGGELKVAGKNLLGRCPFHEGLEASLVVTPAKNLWHFFSCQIDGGPIDWMMKTKHVSFRHA